MNLQGKHALELNYAADGTIFLNFWDWQNGNDVCAEFKGDHLLMREYDISGEIIGEKTVSFATFFELIGETIKEM